MGLGAVVRRSSFDRVRVTGLISATAALFAVAGSFGAGAAVARPYPPGTPCALSWSQSAAHTPVLVGSGYDTDQPVAVTLYPQDRSLGSVAANSAGAFMVPVDVPPGQSSSWVTATSVTRTCSVSPPVVGAPGPPESAPSTPPGGSTTTPGGGASGTPATPVGGTTGNGATGSAGPTGSTAAGRSTGGTASGNGGVGTGRGSVPSGSGYPPSRGSGEPASGSAGPSTAPASSGAPGSTGPTRPGTGSSTPAPQSSLRNASPLGLPLTAIVVIAALLLLAGGLGVLVLTRRSG